VGGALDTRIAVVTGGAGGIGGAIVRRFAAEGATVASVDLPDTVGPEAAVAFPCDLGDLAAISGLIESIAERVGTPDILVNCAAISADTPSRQFPMDAFRRILAVNLEAAVLLATRFGDMMAGAGYGRIVNITSVHGSYGQERCLAYDVTKAALNQATRSLAVDLAGYGVLVNAVAPGFVDTPATRQDGVPAHETDWFRDVYRANRKLPLLRQATSTEIAEVVLWLAAETNSYVTGQVITADGGLTATF
jgi:NAD(P)-dependent dehydrogenase (short-subunit alcohol dehydrogenase family)